MHDLKDYRPLGLPHIKFWKKKIENQDGLTLASEYGTIFQQEQQMSVKIKNEWQQFDVLLWVSLFSSVSIG